MVVTVGIEPTSLDFQSTAMTTSAKLPINGTSGENQTLVSGFAIQCLNHSATEVLKSVRLSFSKIIISFGFNEPCVFLIICDMIGPLALSFP